jgi:WYL_2, Sm-like SH3 beta-barrel fold
MKKELFKAAWQMLKENLFTTFSEALKAAWNRFKLLAQLKKGIAYFSFKKADGSTRVAVGTLRNDNFSYESKGTDKVAKIGLVKFWDVENRAFRSLNIENFISFN